MTDNTPMGKAQHHASNALAIAGLGVLLGLNILAYADGIFPSWPLMLLAIAGTGFFAVVNFLNTVEENSPWKSYGAVIGILITAAIYAGPIGKAFIHQP